MPKNEMDSKALVNSLRKVVEGVLRTGGNLSFSQEPEVNERALIEYNSRMRVMGMEKFNAPCYVSAINYFLDESRQKRQDASGVLVVYIEEDAASKLLSALGYKTAKGADEGVILDHCGEFCNLISGNFKKEWGNLGLPEMISTAPVTAKNTISSGVEFPYSQYSIYEFSFWLWKQKSLVVDLCMAPVI